MQRLIRLISALALIIVFALTGYWYVTGGNYTLRHFFTGTTHHPARDTWAVYANTPFGYRISIPPGSVYEETGNPIGRVVTLYPDGYTDAVAAPFSIEVFIYAGTYGEAVQAARQKITSTESMTSDAFTIPGPGSVDAVRFTFKPISESAEHYATERTLFAVGQTAYQITLFLRGTHSVDQTAQAAAEQLAGNIIIELANNQLLSH